MNEHWQGPAANRHGPDTGRPARRGQPATGGRSWRGRWRSLSTGRKIGYCTAAAITSLAVLLSLGAYGFYAKLEGNLTVINPFAGLNHRPPASASGVLNILILGSQTRDGQGPGFGYDPGTDLSDNLILVHLDAAHTHATIVSIPRDTMVYEPACRSRSSNAIVPAQQQAIIDGAMNLGGPACAVATVEHLTNIRMDHFVEFDFNSFRSMVDTLGGVEVCIPQAYDDPWSHLHLSAGKHLITGDQALAFVRTRHGVGTGGDLGRIELQQEFISSLIQKLKSQGTLDNPVKLFDIADAATKAVTVDPGLGSIAKLLGLATTLRNLHTNDVTFVTMPTITDPANTNRLLPDEPDDDVLWQMLQHGQLWRGHLAAPKASQVSVRVLNGTGVPGLAHQTAAKLRKLGFKVAAIGNAPATATTTLSYPGSAQAGGAYTLAQALDQAPSANGNAGGGLTLTIGADFAGVQAPPHSAARHSRSQPADRARQVSSPPDGTQPAVQTRNAAANICSGMPAANPQVGAPP